MSGSRALSCVTPSRGAPHRCEPQSFPSDAAPTRFRRQADADLCELVVEPVQPNLADRLRAVQDDEEGGIRVASFPVSQR